MYLMSTPSSGSVSLSSRNISNVRLFSPYLSISCLNPCPAEPDIHVTYPYKQ